MSGEGPFAVPLAAYQLGIHTARKRKRATTSTSTVSADPTFTPAVTSSKNESRASSPTASQFSSHRPSSSRSLPADSINPLSHSPDTLHQFIAAGLSPQDENPSTLYPGFPHKPLPADAHYFLESSTGAAVHGVDNRSFYDGSDADELDGEDAGTIHGAGKSRDDDRGRVVIQKQTARLKHISVMTALVHRCIAKGDIARAKRAFGLLAQTRGVDIKLNNFWLVGAEILMRQGETLPEGRYEEMTPRWGRADNADTVRSYFEHLIAHYPYDKHRPHLVSAVDFYPALYNFEVHHVSAEFGAALERLETEYRQGQGHDNDDGDDDDNSQHDTSDLSNGDSEQGAQDRGLRSHSQDSDEDFNNESYRHSDDDAHARRTFRQEATDEIRRQTQLLAQQIATNMDRTMENPPFASHPELLRLRANLAIFIADLYLPTRIVEKVLRALGIPRLGSKNNSKYDSDVRGGNFAGQTQRRRKAAAIMDNLAKYVHEPEEQAAVLDMRPQEQRRARDLFRKVMAQGVVVEAWVEKFVAMVGRWDEEEDESVDY